MSRLILCADDFGFSPAISRTIAALARVGQLNATSCMAVCAGWPDDAPLLFGLPAGFQVGLHLVLTDETPLTAMPTFAPGGTMPAIDPLTRDATLGRLPLDEIAGEVAAQVARFIQAMGRAPAFVDGHQHSHILRGIRDVVLAEVARSAPGAWVRDCTDRASAIARRPFRSKAIGSAAHALGFRRAARRHGVDCNTSFAGHYDFQSDFAELFPRFLRSPGATHLVMCHPGAGERPGDTIAAARTREATVLRDLPIADMAARHGLEFTQ